MRTHSAQTIPQAEAKGSLQVSKERVSVIPFRFLVHLSCHIFLMFPEEITGIPASRDKGMPFSHPSAASAGAAGRSCSNVQRVIKENA